MMIQRMLRAYSIKNTMTTSLIQQDISFKRMTPDGVLGRIINHEMLIEEANHAKNLSKGITSSRKQVIAFKASKKGKSKRVVEERSSEEEDEESIEYDPEEMTLFIRRISKLMNKQKFFKGDKKNKLRTRTKRACYNCGKYSHFIANCPYECRDEDDDKKKSYKREKNFKKKPYGEAHIGKEWDLDEESSDSDSDGVATMAIKGSSSS
jgi:hypothetical protein